ncbi:peptidase inhibitor family I36 protein [Amycolatopsis sp. NPDC051373]|uniref:peptidase inhibitor family I36 protein n=1 Tax=Amycolatopsis sp. NPDC051373 TaxID=3155801 RepID=UPI00344B308A
MSKTVPLALPALGLLLAAGSIVVQAPAHAATMHSPVSASGIEVQKSIANSGKTDGVMSGQAGGWERCPQGYYCLFDGYDGAGAMAFFKTGSPNLANQGLDKAASSQWNRSPWNFCVYEGYNYTGRRNCDPPNSRYNFTYYGGNNFDSSVKRL